MVAGLVVIGCNEVAKMVAKMEVMVVVDEMGEVCQKKNCRMRKIYKIKNIPAHSLSTLTRLHTFLGRESWIKCGKKKTKFGSH